MDHVCCYCSCFINLFQLEILSNNNAIVLVTFETNIICRFSFDICGCCSGIFNFCHEYWTHISKSKKPKFGISNKMPQLCCQYYPGPLEGLTSANEAIIARAHSVILILKLMPNNSFNLGSYKGVCRHSIFLPQNLGPLLKLLPSETTSVDNVIRIV